MIKAEEKSPPANNSLHFPLKPVEKLDLSDY